MFLKFILPISLNFHIQKLVSYLLRIIFYIRKPFGLHFYVELV